MITRTIQKERGAYPITDVRVIDGDAIEATIHLDFGCLTRKRLRLKGWWAPELTGLSNCSGAAAKVALEAWVKDKALWILTSSSRCDRYGRIIGHLVHHERIVDPRAVLGQFQLTEAQHKEQRDVLARIARGVRGHVSDPQAAPPPPALLERFGRPEGPVGVPPSCI